MPKVMMLLNSGVRTANNIYDVTEQEARVFFQCGFAVPWSEDGLISSDQPPAVPEGMGGMARLIIDDSKITVIRAGERQAAQ